MIRSVACFLVLVVMSIGSADGQDLEVDHVFVMVPAAAPVRSVLGAAGFRVRPDSGVHEGIGTASFGIAFANAYLEIVWVVDSADFAGSPFGLAARLTANPPGSPYGIGLRRAVGYIGDLPFETRPYQADWMLPEAPTEVAAWTGHVLEPAVFVVSPPMSWTATVEEFPLILAGLPHPNGIRELTRVRLVGPELPVESVVVRALESTGLVEFVSGPKHVLELVFDRGTVENRDFLPTLPLVVWHR